MSKKQARWVTAGICGAALLLGLLAGVQSARLRESRRELRRNQEHALEELYAAVEGMDEALEKSQYAASPRMMAALCAETRSRAEAASIALGVLPLSAREWEQTAAFLSRAGDYAAYLLRKSAGGEELSPEEHENIRALREAAAMLHEELAALRMDTAEGLLTIEAPGGEEPGLFESMARLEQEFPELPSLVYDGPFSHRESPVSGSPLEEAAQIDRDQALIIGAGYLDTRTNLAEVDGQIDGEIPVFRVRAGDYTAHVTMQGGYMLRILCSRQAGRTVLTTEDALEIAREYMHRQGYRSMKESYWTAADNILTVSFCYETRGVRYYPDMVKLSLYLDTGELAGLDAESYVLSHSRREPPAAAVSAEEARTLVSPELTVLNERLSVIPTPGGGESFCWEFLCENESGRHYLIYVSALTGTQERILILLEDETGTLAV